MKIKVEEPSIPKDIQQKTRNLQVLLGQADSLRDEILAWYAHELKPYDDKADAEQELFDPGTGTTVEGISEPAILEEIGRAHV